VFPQWLLQELGIRDNQVSAVHLFKPLDGASPMELLSTRDLALENIREGQLCAACNNGWMSDLENSCRETLLSLVGFRYF
jgi:hypothetical protein